MSAPPRVLIAHPSALLRTTLDMVLQARGLAVVGRVEGVADLAPRCVDLSVQVLICADRFPDGHLVPVLPSVLTSGARVLVVADQHGDEVVDVLLAGASGCLFLTDATPDDVAKGVRTVAKGASALHPLAAQAVLSRWRAERAGAGAAVAADRSALTNREREVLAAMVAGRSAREVADAFAISVKTVEAHKARIFAKLGARNQAHAVALARSAFPC